MDGRAVNPEEERDAADVGQALPAAAAAEDRSGAGEGDRRISCWTGSPGHRTICSPLARAQKIDLSRISLKVMLEQLAAALRQTSGKIPLGQKGDWAVMTAWLVQLRARLLLSDDASAGQEAATEANQFRSCLVALDDIQALAFWLERPPQLGHDVFGRGQPELFGVSVAAGQAVDVVEFLWASLALFDDDTAVADTATVYQARPFELYAVAEARDRILQRLAEAPEGGSLERFLPEPAKFSEREVWAKIRLRSAWSSTFIAGLELAKQDDVLLGQGGDFATIHVAPASAGPPA
jgi:segregation and condensation protein A